jgi:hypothetical protein
VVAVRLDLAPRPSGRAEVLVAAAYLHDLGYAPPLVETDLHTLDGARHLRALGHERLAGLVPYHLTTGPAGEVVTFEEHWPRLNAALAPGTSLPVRRARPSPRSSAASSSSRGDCRRSRLGHRKREQRPSDREAPTTAQAAHARPVGRTGSQRAGHRDRARHQVAASSMSPRASAAGPVSARQESTPVASVQSILLRRRRWLAHWPPRRLFAGSSGTIPGQA